MKLQTNIPIEQKSGNLIDYSSELLLLGSCFSENIGAKLEYFKLKNVINPFGILFHPLAIEKLIERAVDDYRYKDEVFQHNEQWLCLEAHSKLNGNTQDEVLKNLNESIQLTRIQLEAASHIIITYGTSWVYKYIITNQYVANCHKIPQKEFDKELLTVDVIEKSISNTINLIRELNSKAQIIFTISPVRHLKDGFVENSRSKAHLIAGLDEALSDKNIGISYFPSYEIMLDELRDYRFYNDDMVHPNHLAINYIFEKFLETWLHPQAFSVMNEIDQIQKGLIHRPFNANSNSHKKFLKKLNKQINLLSAKYQHIKF